MDFALGAVCDDVGGTWDTVNKECYAYDVPSVEEFKIYCEDGRGVFNDCASPCRNTNAKANICSQVCVLTCDFKK